LRSSTDQAGSALPPLEQWSDKVSYVSQVGGIETSVIDNGRGRGVRSAWINTGSGLRFRVVPDRGLDIVDARYNHYSLAWISHNGLISPDPSADTGVRWLDAFSGGLMTTCGLTHVGGPETDDEGERGLHGRISNIVAEVESVVQPDLQRGDLGMSITGIVRQSTTFGHQLELRRTISSELGSSEIQIHDEVTNRGNLTAPHMLLYHCNFGWPLVDDGAAIRWRGTLQEPVGEQNQRIFGEDRPYRQCQAPLEEHSGAGEAVGIIDVEPEADGLCRCGIYNESIGFGLQMTFQKEQLNWLTNWQHWGRNEYVTALEPGTHPPIGQSAARENNTLIMLEPGMTREYDLKFEIVAE